MRSALYLFWPAVGMLFLALLAMLAYAYEPWIGVGFAAYVISAMLIGWKFIDG